MQKKDNNIEETKTKKNKKQEKIDLIKEKRKEKENKKNRYHKIFSSCENPISFSEIAALYAERRIQRNDFSPFGMYKDWVLNGNGKTFNEAIEAMEFFLLSVNYPEVFSEEEMDNSENVEK